ncbi:MAG: 2,3-bisphosphoglycerate-independent phosphoglycerate mutase [bacterium]|nr:2,3-bisphosphoglycerate-independent phosphoglycerate mutase [bacterium]
MKKVLLTIIDGFGYREEKKGNAVIAANPENIISLWKEYPHTTLQASGEEVGLPKGQMGNSEVGHLNIGAGRVVDQPLMQINHAIEDGSFFKNEVLLDVINHCKKNKSDLHLFCLLSDGGIHSHINHLFAMLDLCKKEDFSNVYVHAFLDGRDTLPNIALTYLDELDNKLKELGIGKLRDVSGRYYSMDRERMWNLTKEYYDLLVHNKGEKISSYKEYINASYEKGIMDEFIVPARLMDEGNLKENDGMVMVNFRPDRITQLFTAITNKEFKEFERVDFKNTKLVTMMTPEHTVISTPAFPPMHLTNTLGEYAASKGLKVLRIAEASKYPHVTYFFDGGEEKELPNTDKIIVPRKDVATYDLYPKMSAYEVADKLIEVMDNYDLIILNFANCDMVGHTGKFNKVEEAVRAVDENVKRLYDASLEKGFTMFVTADHGNSEIMVDDKDEIITSHTTSPVPFIITDNNIKNIESGKLGDIAPTILDYMGLDIPTEMTGNKLI